MARPVELPYVPFCVDGDLQLLVVGHLLLSSIIVVQVQTRSFAPTIRVILTRPRIPLELMAKSVLHLFYLEAGFAGLVVEVLLGCFKQHRNICSTQSGRVQVVVDAIEEVGLPVSRQPLIL